MRYIRILITLLLVGLSQQGIASIAVLQQTLKADEIMTDVRNDANLWQGYLHRNNKEKAVFHTLIDDGEITWWREESAENNTDYSEEGQLADSATTVIGMVAGAAEMNPLGILVLPAKYLMNKRAESLEYAQCKAAKGSMGASGYGAAASNVTTLITGSFGPLSIIAGLIAANVTHKKSVDDAYCQLWVGSIVKEQIDGLITGERIAELSDGDVLRADTTDYMESDEYSL